MKLSIIIINFNVKYFLEQCLHSVSNAIKQIQAEVWVVDNASSDGSLEYLKPLFPFVQFLANKTNVGFSRANNQALEFCTGEYILFLNPDTILSEDCLVKSLSFLDNQTDAGALGIRMVDGKGRFLPESKRSFPTPFTALYKLAGLTALFPTSRIFARYYVAYLNEFKNHEVDVLSGAFMVVRRSLLLKLKGFDENFFMYGEDIDLSYRIKKQGFKNYYFSGSCIIHFKGESTRRGSLNYVKMFYGAMSIFVKKYSKGLLAKAMALFIQAAIWVRASVSALVTFVVKIGMPLIDTVLIYCAFNVVNLGWIHLIRNGNGFREDLVNISLTGFTFIFLATASFAGIYDKQYRPSKAFVAASIAIVAMLSVYSLLPENFRFSRGVMLFGGFAALIFITIVRWLLLNYRIVEDDDETGKQEQTLVVGGTEEYNEVYTLFEEAGLSDRIMGRIAVNGAKDDAIATIEELNTLVESIQVKEIVVCEGYLNYKQIIGYLQELPVKLSIKFHGKGTKGIVGSDSKKSLGEFVSAEKQYQISSPYQQRMKKTVDVLFAGIFLFAFPVYIPLAGCKIIIYAVEVLAGKKTWVGYSVKNDNLPELKKAILSVTGFPLKNKLLLSPDVIARLDALYAKNYDWKQDVKIIMKSYKRIGGRY